MPKKVFNKQNHCNCQWTCLFVFWWRKSKAGREVWVILVELWQTWLEYDTRFGKKDASTSLAIDAAAAMATGPWIGYVDYYGVTHSQCQASLIMYITMFKMNTCSSSNTHTRVHCAVTQCWIIADRHTLQTCTQNQFWSVFVHTHFITHCAACAHADMLSISTLLLSAQ